MTAAIGLGLILCLSAFCRAVDFSACDFNHDGVVDERDLCELGGLWLNDCYVQPCYELDINRDDFVDAADLGQLGRHWLDQDPGACEIAHWRLDEATGLIAHDVVGGHDAVLCNLSPYAWGGGPRQWALSFDGSDDYLSIEEVDDGLGRYFQRDFSIAVWIKQGPQSSWQTVIGIESTSRYTQYAFEGFTIELEDGRPLLYIAIADDARTVVSASRPLQAGVWEHLAVVRAGDGVDIYLNGLLDSVHQITDDPIKFDSEWPGYDVIGATNDSYYGPTTFMNGRLDDIHLYNFPISEQLVIQLAAADHAWRPDPADHAAFVSIDSDLTWQKGSRAQAEDCHDVYLGLDQAVVAAADRSTGDIYQGCQTARRFTPGQDLLPSQSYYWRVDSINGGGVTAGPVWHFDTSNGEYAVTASSHQVDCPAHGAYQADRFSLAPLDCWKGAAHEGFWWWQIAFAQPRRIGSILHVFGDHDNVLDHAPTEYTWKVSADGETWQPLIAVTDNARLYRIDRLDAAMDVAYLRLEISDCAGAYPALREVEFYPETDSVVIFPDWIVALCITESSALPGHAQGFITLARTCNGWQDVPAQEIWLGDFDPDYLALEPRPLCAFLSGSFIEWCQRTRGPFAGLQQVLDEGNLPIWGSCGGAQVLGILADTGYDHPWDCPRCRDPRNPFSPIYGHIGYLDPENPGDCGDYQSAIMEVGPTFVTQLAFDPVFVGVPQSFLAYESHMGQLEYLPPNWSLIVTNGLGGLTTHQCFRRNDRYVYGAQFHIENYHADTWHHAQTIMTNFLSLAQQWGGYQP